MKKSFILLVCFAQTAQLLLAQTLPMADLQVSDLQILSQKTKSCQEVEVKFQWKVINLSATRTSQTALFAYRINNSATSTLLGITFQGFKQTSKPPAPPSPITLKLTGAGGIESLPPLAWAVVSSSIVLKDPTLQFGDENLKVELVNPLKTSELLNDGNKTNNAADVDFNETAKSICDCVETTTFSPTSTYRIHPKEGGTLMHPVFDKGENTSKFNVQFPEEEDLGLEAFGNFPRGIKIQPAGKLSATNSTPVFNLLFPVYIHDGKMVDTQKSNLLGAMTFNGTSTTPTMLQQQANKYFFHPVEAGFYIVNAQTCKILEMKNVGTPTKSRVSEDVAVPSGTLQLPYNTRQVFFVKKV